MRSLLNHAYKTNFNVRLGAKRNRGGHGHGLCAYGPHEYCVRTSDLNVLSSRHHRLLTARTSLFPVFNAFSDLVPRTMDEMFEELSMGLDGRGCPNGRR